MKVLALMLGLGLTLSSSVMGQSTVRFLEVYDVREGETAPPQLFATALLACNERVLKPLRENFAQAVGSVDIHIGVLVVRDDTLDCVNVRANEVHIGFGPTFSGLGYDIYTMKK